MSLRKSFVKKNHVTWRSRAPRNSIMFDSDRSNKHRALCPTSNISLPWCVVLANRSSSNPKVQWTRTSLSGPLHPYYETPRNMSISRSTTFYSTPRVTIAPSPRVTKAPSPRVTIVPNSQSHNRPISQSHNTVSLLGQSSSVVHQVVVFVLVFFLSGSNWWCLGRRTKCNGCLPLSCAEAWQALRPVQLLSTVDRYKQILVLLS